MKTSIKYVGTSKQINGFLGKCRVPEFKFDCEIRKGFSYDFDSWINEEQTKGLCVQVEPFGAGWYVSVTRYRSSDLLESEK